MSCELSASTLHGYFDGELDAVRASEFEQHVATCPQCRESLKTMGLLREGLQRGDLYEPASSRLRSRITEKVGSKSPVPRWKSFLVPAFSLAVVVIATWLGLFLLQPHSYSVRMQAELIDAHVRSLQPGHLTDVQSTDQHTVKPWFDGKLDFIPPVGDFSQQGFPLIGGRLDVLDSHNVAALVYGRRKHLINLFVWPDGKQASFSGDGTRQGYNWLSWHAGDMQFWLVSDVSPGDLQELKALIQR